VRRLEVRDAGIAGATVGDELGDRLPGGDIVAAVEGREWPVDEEQVDLVDAEGYRHIDTAQAYGTEPGVGKALADSDLDRDEVYITSKLANSNHAPDAVNRSFDQTMTLVFLSVTSRSGCSASVR
jgi:aryl-alcohol dehydrogenase-like predicted oxidoreductase